MKWANETGRRESARIVFESMSTSNWKHLTRRAEGQRSEGGYKEEEELRVRKTNDQPRYLARLSLIFIATAAQRCAVHSVAASRVAPASSRPFEAKAASITHLVGEHNYGSLARLARIQEPPKAKRAVCR